MKKQENMKQAEILLKRLLKDKHAQGKVFIK